jgi:hypothetical protein
MHGSHARVRPSVGFDQPALLPQLPTTVWVNRTGRLDEQGRSVWSNPNRFRRPQLQERRRAGSRERLPRPMGWIRRPMCSNEHFTRGRVGLSSPLATACFRGTPQYNGIVSIACRDRCNVLTTLAGPVATTFLLAKSGALHRQSHAKCDLSPMSMKSRIEYAHQCIRYVR